MTSSPFAIITDAGNTIKSNSVPSFLSINAAIISAILKFIIKRIQFFLKELFTENAFGDFKIILIIERDKMSVKIHKKLSSEKKVRLLKLFL